MRKRTTTPRPPRPSEIVETLRDEILTWRNSYQEGDGVIRDRMALRAIRHLEAAIERVLRR